MTKTISIKEFSKLSGFPQHTCYQLVKRDDFPARKIGKSWRILKSEVDKWLLNYFKEGRES